MNWDITETTVDGFFFASIKMDEGTHIVACAFINVEDLPSFDIASTEEIEDPNTNETYHTGDHILVALATHYGNQSNTCLIPCNRKIDSSGERTCMILVHKEDEEYSIKRVKRTTNKVSDAYPIG